MTDIQFSATPLQVEIFDDWSLLSASQQPEDQPLRLSFTVIGEEIVAVVTISTIPKLLTHASKFRANLEAQRDGASRESQTFRVTRSPKPDHPLTAVAQALLHSARDRLKEAESNLIYTIRQHLSFRLRSMRLVVFPRTMLDSEMVQFVGRDIHARLNRAVQLGGRHQTDLRLSISSVVISKFNQLHHTRAYPNSFDSPNWLARVLESAVEAIIVGLPSMKISMSGEEDLIQSTRSLAYDFHSRFVRQEGMKEQDIYITLNMALYSWLTLLRRNLSREMDQINSSAQPIFTLAGHPITSVRPQTSTQQLVPRLLVPQIGSKWEGTLTEQSVTTHDDSRDLSSADSASLATSNPILTVSETQSQAIADAPGFSGLRYQPRQRHIERLTMRQLGEATPDVMHPFFMKKAGFNLEEFLPQYVHEYATLPLSQVMEMLLKIYSKQLPVNRELK